MDHLEEDSLDEDFLEEAGFLRISSLITIFTGSSLALDKDCLEGSLRLVGNSRKDFFL